MLKPDNESVSKYMLSLISLRMILKALKALKAWKGNLKGISQGVVIEHDRPERRPPKKENPSCAGRGRAIKVNKNAERS